MKPRFHNEVQSNSEMARAITEAQLPRVQEAFRARFPVPVSRILPAREKKPLVPRARLGEHAFDTTGTSSNHHCNANENVSKKYIFSLSDLILATY